MGWQFEYRPSRALPPLAWIATLADGAALVRCGTSVRREPEGFFEGTWVGGSHISAAPESTAVFGSGIVADGDSLIIVPPSHPTERVYLFNDHGARRWTVSNSLAAVLETADLELDPDVLYPPIFVAAADGVRNPTMEVPTSRGPLLTAVYYNFRLTREGGLTVQRRPRERPFATFADFRDRVTAALQSAVDNAGPGYEMVVSISSGYDSTAVAAIAASVGCRRAVTFRQGKPVRASDNLDDSGAPAAQQLGLDVSSFDRLAYMGRDDLPEAEFLSTGMSGEDVVMAAMEPALHGAILLTGSEEFRLKGNPYRPALYRGDLSACSMSEFRIRTDFIHLPLLFFGASEKLSLIQITDSAEMAPWTMPGVYDKPIQRRLAEDAGVKRGTFATIKRRASARIHADGVAALAPATRQAVADFARREGHIVPSGVRAPIRGWHRILLKQARRLGLDSAVSRLARRRRALIHIEPVLGSLLFRWAVAVVRERYAQPDDASAPNEPADLKSSADA